MQCIAATQRSITHRVTTHGSVRCRAAPLVTVRCLALWCRKRGSRPAATPAAPYGIWTLPAYSTQRVWLRRRTQCKRGFTVPRTTYTYNLRVCAYCYVSVLLCAVSGDKAWSGRNDPLYYDATQRQAACLHRRLRHRPWYFVRGRSRLPRHTGRCQEKTEIQNLFAELNSVNVTSR